jgi:hypothetical protein
LKYFLEKAKEFGLEAEDNLDDFLLVEVVSEFVESLQVFDFLIFRQGAFVLFLLFYNRS